MTDKEQDPKTLQPTLSPAGDFGRRVRFARERLGLSLEQVAERGGMSSGYVEYLESRPNTFPSSATVARLAMALETSISELTGSNAGHVGGRAPAAVRPYLLPIGTQQSWTLLGTSGVGRIIFDSDDGPIALPVNYAVADHAVFIRTSRTSSIARIDSGAKVSFEADHIDEAMSSGWSVLVRATCERIEEGCDVEATYSVKIDPWAGGERDTWIRLQARSITGRTIETDR